VAQRGFATSFRGFDQGEVRAFLEQVADELRRLRDYAATLERALAAAEEQAAHPHIDENTLMTAVGEETASILRSAKAAAADIKAKAEDNAARVLREAHARADAVRGEAEGVLAKRVEEAEHTVAGVREAAEAAAERLGSDAVEAARQMLDQAKHEAKVTLDAAHASRDQLLGDLSRKRKVAVVQIEQLRAGRDRLLEAYRTVRRTLDEVTEELQRADAEARAAADAAGRRATYSPAAAGPDLAAPADAVTQPAGAGEPSGAQAVEPGPSASEIPTAPVRIGAPAGRQEAVGESTDAVEDAVAVRVETAPTGISQRPDPTVAVSVGAGPAEASPPPTADLGSTRVAETPTPAEAVPTGGAVELALTGGAAAEGSPSDQPDAPGASEPAATDARAAPPVQPVAGAPGANAVRAGRARRRERAAASLQSNGGLAAVSAAQGESAIEQVRIIRPAEEPEAAPPADEPEAAPPADATRTGQDAPVTGQDAPVAVVANADETLLQRRDQAVGTIEADLARRLKRALQDEQNDLLDRLRSVRGAPTASEVLPERPLHAERFRNAGRPLLEAAARAGADFAASVSGGPGPAGRGADIDDLVDGLATAIVDPLRRRIEQALVGGDDDPIVLAESLGAAYREWKTQRIEQTAGDQVAGAFARGEFAALPTGTPLRWIVEDVDGPCPDCDDNALAGTVAKGARWPTGQAHPPAHVGCRCLLVPSPGDA
jgi:DivIVA domain-containing protein